MNFKCQNNFQLDIYKSLLNFPSTLSFLLLFFSFHFFRHKFTASLELFPTTNFDWSEFKIYEHKRNSSGIFYKKLGKTLLLLNSEWGKFINYIIKTACIINGEKKLKRMKFPALNVILKLWKALLGFGV